MWRAALRGWCCDVEATGAGCAGGRVQDQRVLEVVMGVGGLVHLVLVAAAEVMPVGAGGEELVGWNQCVGAWLCQVLHSRLMA
jgi:hypothetical protein